jgi:hypothetical protein
MQQQHRASYLTDCNAPQAKRQMVGESSGLVGFVSGETRTVFILPWESQRTTSRRRSGIGWYRLVRRLSVLLLQSYLRCATLRLYFRSTVLFLVSDTLFIYLESAGVLPEIESLFCLRDEKQIMVIMNWNTVARNRRQCSGLVSMYTVGFIIWQFQMFKYAIYMDCWISMNVESWVTSWTKYVRQCEGKDQLSDGSGR